MKIGVTISLLASTAFYAVGVGTFAANAQLPTTAVEGGASCPDAVDSADGSTFVALDDLESGLDVEACNLANAYAFDDGVAIALPIPEPGETASIHALVESAADDEASLAMETDEDGTLYLDEVDPRPADPAPPSACEDTAFRKLPSRMNFSETAYFNRSTTPDYLDPTNVAATLEASVRAWPQMNTDCGMVDDVAVGVDWGGNSESLSAVQNVQAPDGSWYTTCTQEGSNTTSVMSFGLMQPGLLGATCRWGSFPTQGADIKFNTRYKWTRTPLDGNCSGELDLQSVATHETGHWWGLDHVDASAHPYMTMRSAAGASFTCKTVMRSLGRGDALGMRSHYPN